MGFGQEDLSELEGRGFDQLVVPAVGRTLVGVPADERRPVAQGVALEVDEGPFHDLFRPEGLPGQASPPIPAGRRLARPLAPSRHLPAQVAQPAPGWFSRALSRRGANSAISSDRRAIVSEAVTMRLGFTTTPQRIDWPRLDVIWGLAGEIDAARPPPGGREGGDRGPPHARALLAP
jgi:hypothetical protein